MEIILNFIFEIGSILLAGGLSLIWPGLVGFKLPIIDLGKQLS